MTETLQWWVMMQVVGLALLPLCLVLFRRLPDRGYALSKPFALLLVGYLFWILNVMRVLPNSTGGIWWALLLLAGASAFVLWQRREELLAFVRGHWWLIGAVEALFFLTFITAAYLRSFVGSITHTEQPMDFMFLNAVTQGERFSPPDPWLAGEGVSYYYFGYLLVSVMTRLSGLATSVGYNLGLAMIVALAVVGAFGLVYNLAAHREQRAAEGGPGTPSAGFPTRPLWRPMAFGFVAALLLAVMGNLEGALEWLAAHNFGPQGFWDWLGVNGLTSYDSTRWYPAGDAPQVNWFWFRATRIIEVREGLIGIHEFPFFSFFLGDLHPHVMSIPFILLVAGAALALLRSEGPLDLVFWLERPFWLAVLAVMLGALAFINTWDMPTMAFLIFLVVLLRNRLLADRWSWGLLLDTAGFALPLFVAAFLAYAPFFFGGFESQASGFTADSSGGTRPFHAFLLWAPFAVLVLPYAFWRLRRSDGPVSRRAVLWSLAPAIAIVVLWLFWNPLTAILGWLPATVQLNQSETSVWTRLGDRTTPWLTVLVVGGSLGLLLLALVREVEATRRSQEGQLSHVFALAAAVTAALLILGAEFFFIQDHFGSRMNTIFKLYYQAWLLLSVAGGFILYELARGWRLPALRSPGRINFEASFGGWSLGELEVLIASFAGAIVGIIVTKDTILAINLLAAVVGGGLFFAGASAVVLFWRATQASPPAGGLSWRAVWAAATTVVLLGAFVYPLIATWNRTEGCVGRPIRLLEGSDRCGEVFARRTLDGLAYLEQNSPGEYAVIQWLADRDGQPVIAEAAGDEAYSDLGRVAASTGVPTVVGWLNHERQWRGSDVDPMLQERKNDVMTLYTSSDPNDVRAILQKYGIDYVVLGPRERLRFGQSDVAGVGDFLEQAFPEDGSQAEAVVYRVRPETLVEAPSE